MLTFCLFLVDLPSIDACSNCVYTVAFHEDNCIQHILHIPLYKKVPFQSDSVIEPDSVSLRTPLDGWAIFVCKHPRRVNGGEMRSVCVQIAFVWDF